MWEAYRPVMDTRELLDRMPPIREEHRALIRKDQAERTRTVAFWESFDANPHSRQRWVDGAAAYWRATQPEPSRTAPDTATP